MNMYIRRYNTAPLEKKRTKLDYLPESRIASSFSFINAKPLIRYRETQSGKWIYECASLIVLADDS